LLPNAFGPLVYGGTRHSVNRSRGAFLHAGRQMAEQVARMAVPQPATGKRHSFGNKDTV